MNSPNAALPRTLPQMLARARAAGPDNTAIIYRDQPITYATLEGSSQRVARGLLELGIGAGDRVALWMPSVPAYLSLTFACSRIGAIAVAVNTRYRAAEVEDIVGRSGARALAYWPGFRGIDFNAILAEVDLSRLSDLESILVYNEEEVPEEPLPLQSKRHVTFRQLDESNEYDGDASIPGKGVKIFTTSGTTKAPKFVLHSQASLTDHAFEVVEKFGLYAPDTVGAVALPLGGVFGFNGALSLIAAQRPMVLNPIFKADDFARQLMQYKVTQWNGADEMIDQLLQTDIDEESLERHTQVGFATFNVALSDIVERAEDRGLRLVSLWGMSEMQALAAKRDPERDTQERRRMGGELTSPTAQVRARDPQTGELLPHGEPGEIEIAGPSRMLGYFQNEAATAEAVTEDGFVRTGDLGRTESDQSFEFITRMGDVMRLGGFLVSPAEVEEEIKLVPGIADVQVVAAPSAAGHRAVAFVIKETGAGLVSDAVQTHCADRLARYKVPAKVVMVDEFPVTLSANGTKIQRSKLREMAATVLKD